MGRTGLIAHGNPSSLRFGSNGVLIHRKRSGQDWIGFALLNLSRCARLERRSHPQEERMGRTGFEPVKA